MDKDIIQEIRQEGEKFLRELNEELYRNLAGLKKGGNISAIYKSHSNLLDPDIFFSLKGISPKDKDGEKGLRLIRGFLARSIIESEIAGLKDKILTIETRAQIQLDDKTVPYRGAFGEIKRESKRKIRQEIDEKRCQIVLMLNPLFLQTLDTMRRISSELGFSYIAMCDEMESLNSSHLESKARLFLKDTEYIYRDLLKWFLLKRMGLKLQDAKRHDIDFLFNSFELRENFPKRDLLAIGRRCLGEMGIEIGENIKLDLEKRREKTSSPFTLPIEVPGKIMLTIYPIGGIEDYESFLHELGASLYYGYREAEDEFEFRRLNEYSSREVFALLFQHLLSQQKWLRRYLKLDTGSDFMQFLHIKRLMMIRYLSGKLIYEISFHKDEDFKGKSESYRHTLKEAVLYECDEADYLNDAPLLFQTASRVRATAIESDLSSYLRGKYDEEWWRVKEAGDFMRKLWEKGGRITSHEISERIGVQELSFATLLGCFQDVFGRL
jgi:hypothetical protein